MSTPTQFRGDSQRPEVFEGSKDGGKTWERVWLCRDCCGACIDKRLPLKIGEIGKSCPTCLGAGYLSKPFDGTYPLIGERKADFTDKKAQWKWHDLPVDLTDRKEKVS